MKREVRLPRIDEDSEEEMRAAFWLAEVGDALEEGGDLLEMVTDKAAFTIPSPFRGVLVEKRVEEGSRIRVGDVLCLLETNPDQEQAEARS